MKYHHRLIEAKLRSYVDSFSCTLVTGSQQWEVMRRLAESLAGRVAMLELPTFCFQEAEDVDPHFSGENWSQGSAGLGVHLCPERKMLGVPDRVDRQVDIEVRPIEVVERLRLLLIR